MIKALSIPQAVNQPLYLLGVLLVAITLLACGGENDYKQIDFTEKTELPHSEAGDDGRKTLRVAVAAMISPKETLVFYREIIDYLSAGIGHEVELIQRKTYGEVNQMLAEGRIDLAFICTGPFVTGAEQSGFTAIATPIVRGEPFYRSYLIVHRDSAWQSLADLKGKDFAFTDPDSNTGALVPRYWLKEIGATPEGFFRGFTYTYSHDNAIMAVAKKLVDGAAVDGHLWEYYQGRNAFYSSQTRVIGKSEPFGSPPIVVSDALAPELKSILVERILSMHQDPDGRRILSELMIDRFSTPDKEWYLPVTRMLERLRSDGKMGNASEKP
jgi:phosphonate transport system substrate-binding protein